MKKMLCIIGTFDVGGAETFMMKVLRNIDRSKYHIDFLLYTDRNCAYNAEAKKLGAKIFVAPPKSCGLFTTLRTIEKIVRDNNFKTVFKISEFSIGALDLWAAKRGGARVLMMRSSNAGTTESKILTMTHYLFRPIANRIINVKMAPSTKAARYTFGDNCIKNGEVIIIKNGLALSEYIIDKKVTNRLKDEVGVRGKYVVAHIGRFSEQKNHEYLIEVFKEIKKRKDNAILLLFGEGELKKKIFSKVQNLGLKQDVIFMGVKNNIYEYLSIVDVIIFPSLFEGMPNAIIEAQAAGVPCVVSDEITKEIKLTNLVEFMSLKDKAEKWAAKALSMTRLNQIECQKVLRNKGYGIDNTIDTIVSNAFVGERNNSYEA